MVICVYCRARPEVMTIGLKSVRELCLRCPLVMNEDLLRVSDMPLWSGLSRRVSMHVVNVCSSAVSKTEVLTLTWDALSLSGPAGVC